MTETLFEIAAFNRPLYRNSSETTNSYHDLVEIFSTTSYALYTEYFIKKIVEDAQNRYHYLHKFNLKKSLRKCIKKFMLTDLELIFLAHYCLVNYWQIQYASLTKDVKIQEKINAEEVDQRGLELFLDLNAYFIKFYIGNQEEYAAIQKYQVQTFPQFTQIYQKWVLSKSKQIFCITPRKINELYREYSMSSVVQTTKKTYNDLVDTLIELSTTYSIIPNKKGGEKKEKMKNQGDGKFSKRNSGEVGQFVSNENNKRSLTSEIFQIVENSDMLEDEDLPKFNTDFMNSRVKRKSSLGFSSLQSLSRKSQLLAQNNKQKQQKLEEPEPQRSRQKKPAAKISLNFKRKEQKPNQTVLGFLKQPSIINCEQEQKQKVRDPRRVLNQAIGEHNMSFLNLRSNRSSRSNSQLPFLWKPMQDNFFEKSKFG